VCNPVISGNHLVLPIVLSSDSLGVIQSASEIQNLARSVENIWGVYFVPTFNGCLFPGPEIMPEEQACCGRICRTRGSTQRLGTGKG
jgi:hypothetical protein